jgi:Na+-transporting NADH:ubiquinone oxidoreductase subunit NqrB
MKIAYYISTGIVVIGMLIVGVLELIPIQHFIEQFTRVGVSIALMKFMAACKLVGAIILILPQLNAYKNLAYAGFTFIFVGAVFAHLGVSDPIKEYIPVIYNLIAILVSYYTFNKLNRLKG